MKKLSIILACILVAMISCTKSKEVHPEIGDGNDELVTVGMKDVHVKYIPADISEFSKVVFRYCPANANGSAQQFAAAEMTKNETLFELTLNDLLKDTLYWYYYELYPNGGDAFNTPQKTFHTQVIDAPEPPVAELPTVTTAEVSEITSNTAQCGGDVINDGGATVTEFGICWSTNANPTLDDSHVAVGAGIGHFFASMTNLEANTTYHVRAYATNEKGTAYGLDREFVTDGGCDCGYVDLGLPSGTLWATCNVGANAPEEYGDYFAWGETQPKNYYDWNTYQHCNNGDFYTPNLIRYCTNPNFGYNGFTDNLTTLLPEDDAATVNWGDGWRMPTKEEFQELCNNTTIIGTTQNGVNGKLFTASNGNSIFLPAAGWRWRDELDCVETYGSYWSSSLYTSIIGAHELYFYLGCDVSNGGRVNGCPIRAVRSAE